MRTTLKTSTTLLLAVPLSLVLGVPLAFGGDAYRRAIGEYVALLRRHGSPPPGGADAAAPTGMRLPLSAAGTFGA